MSRNSHTSFVNCPQMASCSLRATRSSLNANIKAFTKSPCSIPISAESRLDQYGIGSTCKSMGWQCERGHGQLVFAVTHTRYGQLVLLRLMFSQACIQNMQAWLRANSRWTPFSNHKVNSKSSIPHHSIVPMHIPANPLHQRIRWRLPHVDFVRLHKATSTFNGANRSTATATLRHYLS